VPDRLDIANKLLDGAGPCRAERHGMRFGSISKSISFGEQWLRHAPEYLKQALAM